MPMFTSIRPLALAVMVFTLQACGGGAGDNAGSDNQQGAVTVTPTAQISPLPRPITSGSPTASPSLLPAPSPLVTSKPNVLPTGVTRPSVVPTLTPSVLPPRLPLPTPSVLPTALITPLPSLSASAPPAATVMPTVVPSSVVSRSPTQAPTVAPTAISSVAPTAAPSVSVAPSVTPTTTPTSTTTPTAAISATPVPTVVLSERYLLQWVTPDTRIDGSALDASEIAGYVLRWTNTQTLATGEVTLGADQTQYQLELPQGLYRFELASKDSNGRISAFVIAN